MSRRDPVEPPDATVTLVEHVCVPPQWMTRAILVLAGVLAAALVGIGFGAVYVYQASQYVQGRGEFRDAEAKRLEKDIHNGQCELLDAFPASPLLDDVRRSFDCGPGRPLEEFPPEVQQGFGGDATAEVPTLPPGVELAPDGFGDGADPGVVPQQPYFPSPGVAEPPATVPYPPGFPPPDPVQPTDPPLVDLTPVTDELCAALGVCA